MQDLTLDDFLATFAALTGDAVLVGFRRPDDEEARVVWVNDAFLKLFEYARDEILDSWVHITNDPADRENFLQQVNPQIAAGQTQFQAETYCVKKDGGRFWARISVFITHVAAGRFFSAIYHDLSALHEREMRAARALEERDAALAEIAATQSRLIEAINALPESFSIWDDQERLAMYNRGFGETVYGDVDKVPVDVTLQEVVTRLVEDNFRINSGATSAQKAEAVASVMHSLRQGPAQFVDHFSNGQVWRTSSHQGANGDTMVLSTDITELETSRRDLKALTAELRAANEVSQHQALHDDLTGLGNRRFLLDALARMTQRLATKGDGQIVAFQIDLDRFKHVNDTQGHAVGDALLRFVADRLSAAAVPGDVIARTGGDEFVVLRFAHQSDLEIEAFAQAVISDLVNTIDLDGIDVRIGASVGISTTAISSPEDLLIDSDVALYKAKSNGRNGFCHFRHEDRAEMERIKQVSDDILRGIDAAEFIPVYQPQVDARSGRLVGFEALARWEHPHKGLLNPSYFLSLAEDLNVVERIDAMMFARALDEIPRLFADGMCPALSFNVSHRRLMSSDVVQDAKLAAQYPGEVAFELLESVYLDEQDEASALQIDAIKSLGVKVEIDDFGSGHASIIGLEQVRPDRLKIDQRLVEPIAYANRSMTMVKSIVDIAQALDIGVTAEGVERPEQVKLLRAAGCDRLQGFLIGRPTQYQHLPALLETLESHLDLLRAG